MTAARKNKVLDRDALLAHVKNEIITIPVPKWQADVRIKCPTFQDIARMKLEYPDEQDFQFHFLTAALIDLQPGDVKALQSGNGLKYAQLLDAVMGASSPLTDAVVGKS